MGLPARLSGFVNFLRGGYPAGVPARGYVPLIALLPRRLTDDEVTVIMRKLTTRMRWPIGRVDVGVEITHVTDQLPSQEDIGRVQQRIGPGESPEGRS
jgi:Protein of unknown function (DUF3349)